MTYQERKAEIENWLKELRLWKSGEVFRFEEREEGRGRLTFCTAANTYSISFTDAYLGGGVSSRTVRPGESWTRGNDIHDGKFSRETWDHILRDILGYELVALDPVMEQVATPAEPSTS